MPSPKEPKQVIKIEATDVDSIKNEPNLEIEVTKESIMANEEETTKFQNLKKPACNDQ